MRFSRSRGPLVRLNHAGISGAGVLSHPELERRIAALGDAQVSLGGRIAFAVPYTLAIGPDQAAPWGAPQEFRALAARAVVRQAPVGADLTLQLYADGSLWLTITIADGEAEGLAEQSVIDAAPTVPANAAITLDIISVGTPTFPGSWLTAMVDV